MWFQFDRPKKCRNLEGLNLNEFEIFWNIYTALCTRHFGFKPLSYGSGISHTERINISNVQSRGFGLID